MCKVLACIEHLAAGRFRQPENGLAKGGFAAARLANQAECFALAYVEGHAVDGTDEF